MLLYAEIMYVLLKFVVVCMNVTHPLIKMKLLKHGEDKLILSGATGVLYCYQKDRISGL